MSPRAESAVLVTAWREGRIGYPEALYLLFADPALAYAAERALTAEIECCASREILMPDGTWLAARDVIAQLQLEPFTAP